jgi:hypothetical protein
MIIGLAASGETRFEGIRRKVPHFVGTTALLIHLDAGKERK